MTRVNACVLVFKRTAENAHDDLDFARSVQELRRLAHELGLEDSSLAWALRHVVAHNYEELMTAKELDETDG